MPRFSYTARDRAGKSVTDTLESPSRRDALRMLTARGLHVGAINEQALAKKAGSSAARQPKASRSALGTPKPGEGGRRSFSLGRSATPTRKERLTFLESLYDLVSSGLSAGESVRLLSQRIKEPALKELCVSLWTQISEGAPLSRAMSAYPEVFDSSTINLIQAGEATGSLNDTVKRLIDHLTEQKELRRQLVTSLAYPVFMVIVAFGVIIFFLTFLLPRLQTLLDSLHGKLPTSTKILINFSNFSIQYGWLVVIALAFAGVSFWRWRATEKGRLASDAMLLKVPLIGDFMVAQTVHAFSQTLSVLLENGITAAEALKITERQIENRVHRQKFNEATGRVLEGESLSLALTRTKCFPDLVLDRLSVGENTGNVVPSLKMVAASYQKQISQQLSLFTSVIASAVLVGVFIFVGFIAFAIVSAVFQLSSSFGR